MAGSLAIPNGGSSYDPYEPDDPYDTYDQHSYTPVSSYETNYISMGPEDTTKAVVPNVGVTPTFNHPDSAATTDSGPSEATTQNKHGNSIQNANPPGTTRSKSDSTLTTPSSSNKKWSNGNSYAQAATTPASTLKTYPTMETSPTTSTTDTNNSGLNSNTSPYGDYSDIQDGHRLGKAKIVTVVVLPLLALAIILLVLFVCFRRRRRLHAHHGPLIEAKELSQDRFVPAPLYSPSPQIPPPVAVSSPPAHPVILSTLTPGANASYYTGIDTSDAVSMHDGPGAAAQARTYSFDTDAHEDPPPPYRPRSALPSRETSRRIVPESGLQAEARMSSTQLLAESRTRQTRSPFDDPEDDDAVSDISDTEPQFRGAVRDDMSAVSDLSYQDEPARAHDAV